MWRIIGVEKGRHARAIGVHDLVREVQEDQDKDRCEFESIAYEAPVRPGDLLEEAIHAPEGGKDGRRTEEL